MVKEENAATSSTNDVEKQELKNLEIDDSNEPLEKAKQKPPPGINASVVMLYAMFIAMFTIGWVNLNSCSINRLIPIYLIVAGFVGGVAKFLTKIDNRFAFNMAMILVIFDIFWHGVGTYVVYKEYQPNYDSKLGLYCNRTAYLLAFWILTFQYTLLGMFILISLCYMLMRNDFNTYIKKPVKN